LEIKYNIVYLIVRNMTLGKHNIHSNTILKVFNLYHLNYFSKNKYKMHLFARFNTVCLLIISTNGFFVFSILIVMILMFTIHITICTLICIHVHFIKKNIFLFTLTYSMTNFKIILKNEFKIKRKQKYTFLFIKISGIFRREMGSGSQPPLKIKKIKIDFYLRSL
jgi:hypothetical protein